MATLFLIPCPLAPDTQDESLSPVIKEVIKQTEVYMVENVRTARRFISSLRTGRVIEELEFFLVDKKTDEKTISSFFQKSAGKNIGVISEAGCPGIADPGAVAVRVAHKIGYDVRPLVGPSSIFLALMASGFNGQQFKFNGYLPIERKDRKKAIANLEKDARRVTQIFMETPFRNNQLMADLLEVLSPETRLCVAAEVTGSNEYIKTFDVKQWKTKVPDLHKKPVMFLIGN